MFENDINTKIIVKGTCPDGHLLKVKVEGRPSSKESSNYSTKCPQEEIQFKVNDTDENKKGGHVIAENRLNEKSSMFLKKRQIII